MPFSASNTDDCTIAPIRMARGGDVPAVSSAPIIVWFQTVTTSGAGSALATLGAATAAAAASDASAASASASFGFIAPPRVAEPCTCLPRPQGDDDHIGIAT